MQQHCEAQLRGARTVREGERAEPVVARNSAKGGKQRAISTYRRSQASRHGRRKAHGDPAGAGAATPPPPAVATRARTASKQHRLPQSTKHRTQLGKATGRRA